MTNITPSDHISEAMEDLRSAKEWSDKDPLWAYNMLGYALRQLEYARLLLERRLP